jgi:hypothetical protein
MDAPSNPQITRLRPHHRLLLVISVHNPNHIVIQIVIRNVSLVVHSWPLGR